MLHEYTEYYQRINTNSSTYFSIVYDLFTKNLNTAYEVDFNDFDHIDDFKENVFKDYLIMIVFSVMSLEAFMNDYLAVCLSDELYYENFDKLNIIQKITMIYSLVWEDSFDKSGELFSKIQTLLKNRNLFVHSKSHKIDKKILEKYVEDIEINENELEKQLLKSSRNKIISFLQESFFAIQTIFLFCKAVDAHDSNRKAVVLSMSCITEHEPMYYNQQLEKINNVRVRRKKPCSASRKKPNFDKRKEPKLPELYLLFRVIQAVPLLERSLFF